VKSVRNENVPATSIRPSLSGNEKGGSNEPPQGQGGITPPTKIVLNRVAA
jgi:hypothetical protein